jgi:hypothetical protein
LTRRWPVRFRDAGMRPAYAQILVDKIRNDQFAHGHI